jgi:hypothetical protein
MIVYDMSQVKSQLFVLNSPYQILLACGLCEQNHTPTDNTLLIRDDFSAARTLVELLQNGKNSYFTYSELLPMASRADGLVKRILSSKKNVQKIDAIMRNKTFDRIYTANTTEAESIFALTQAKKPGSSTKTVLIEDGLISYLRKSYKVNFRRRVFGKPVFGSWWISDSDELIDRNVDLIACIFPELMKKQYSNIPTEQVCAKSFSQARLAELVQEWLQLAPAIEGGEKSSKSLLFLLDPPELVPRLDNYSKLMTKLCQLSVDRGFRVLIKAHPRFPELAEELVNKIEGIVVLPFELPSELFCLVKSLNIKGVVGKFSTSQMTFAWLNPMRPVASIYPLMLEEACENFESSKELRLLLLKSTNVLAVSSYREFSDFLILAEQSIDESN